MQDNSKQTIGRVEIIAFPELAIVEVHARIDTGARTSAVSVLRADVQDNRLNVVFFDDAQKTHTFDTYDKVAVASSNGQVDVRYKIRLLVVLGGKKIRAWFTLADRSTQVYPVLIGRNVLRGKFVVDVKEGNALPARERERAESLQTLLHDQERQDV